MKRRLVLEYVEGSRGTFANARLESCSKQSDDLKDEDWQFVRSRCFLTATLRNYHPYFVPYMRIEIESGS